MNLTDRKRITSRKLRKFGITMFAAFGAFALLLFLRGKSQWQFAGFVSMFFLLAGSFLPRMLAPVEKVWMQFAGIIGFIMTNVLLTLVFFLGVTPTGLLMRLSGRDPLHRNFDRNADSYWIDIDHDGPGGRPDKPY